MNKVGGLTGDALIGTILVWEMFLKSKQKIRNKQKEYQKQAKNFQKQEQKFRNKQIFFQKETFLSQK